MKLVRLGSVALLLVLGGIVLLTLSGLVPDISPAYWDFRAAYWNNAGAAMHAGGQDLYALQGFESEKAAYIYPPQLATFFGLLYLLPETVGVLIWISILVASAVWSLWLSVQLAGWRVRHERVCFVALLSVVMFGAFYADVYNGNVNSLVLATMLTGVWLVNRNRPVAGGAVLTAAAFMKVIPVVLLVWLAATKRWKAFAGVALGVAILVHVPVLSTMPVHGVADGYVRAIGLNIEYVERTVTPRLQAQEATGVGGASERNLSISAALSRLFTPDRFSVPMQADQPFAGPLLFELPQQVVKSLAATLALGMFACGVCVVLRRRWHWGSHAGGAGLIFVPAMLGNILCWHFHLMATLLLAIPLAIYVFCPGMNRAVRAQAWSGLLLLFVGVTVFYRVELWWFKLYGLQTLSVILAWAVVAWMLLRASPTLGSCLHSPPPSFTGKALHFLPRR